MLFWHKDSLVLDAPMMSGMKLSQFFGHSLLRMETRMRLSLLRYVLSFSIRSGLELVLIIKPTMYLMKTDLHKWDF